MNETMMQEILTRLDAIGELLGQGAGYAYGLAFRQAFWLNGWLSLLGFGVITYLGVMALRHAKRCAKGNPGESASDFLGLLGGGVGGGVAILVSIFGIWEAIAHIANPHYYALMDLAKLVGR